MANNVFIFPLYPGHININTSLCSYLHICITFNENTESHYGVVREPEFKTRRSAHSQSQWCWIKVLYCTITPALFNINHYDGQKVLSHKGIIQKRWRNASKAKKVANNNQEWARCWSWDVEGEKEHQQSTAELQQQQQHNSREQVAKSHVYIMTARAPDVSAGVRKTSNSNQDIMVKVTTSVNISRAN